MKAKKKSGSTKGKSSGKRAVKDLPPRKTQDVKGGTITKISLTGSGGDLPKTGGGGRKG